jgi:O-antigen biosynthesis protein
MPTVSRVACAGAWGLGRGTDVSESPRFAAAEESHLFTLTAPVAVRSLDISLGFPDFELPPARSGEPYHGLAVLLREGDDPIGWLEVAVPPTGEVAGELLERAYREEVAPQALAREPDVTQESPAPTFGDPNESMFVSHVVTTCNNAQLAARCVQSIIASEGGPFEIVVVENRPAGSNVREALSSAFPDDGRVLVVDEPRPGLSRARNAGLKATHGEVVAFTDDDIVVDPHWVEAIRRAFARYPDVSCVAGPILPAELETPAQVLMECFSPIGTAFVRRLYAIDRPPLEQPLFPYTAGYFGSGGNVAFRWDALVALEGFDAALGTGTPARGGEDLDIFIRLLLAGQRLLYEPSAIVWHPHPETMDRLSREVFDYGVGLGAMLTKQLVAGPHRFRLIGKIPAGVQHLLSSASRKNATKGPDYPAQLDRLEHLGLAIGPAAYLCSRQSRRARFESPTYLRRRASK